MNIRILGVTNGMSDISSFKEYSGVQAGICYMKDSYDALAEDAEKAIKRCETAIKNGHQSIMEHIYITVLFEDVSKLFAMYLNSLKAYNTSEKSGRYTKIAKDNLLYDKWSRIFTELHTKNGTPNKINEDSRYILSVLNKGTTFAYTASWRTWLNIGVYCRRYNLSDADKFEYVLREEFLELIMFIKANLEVPEFSEPTGYGKFNFVQDNFDNVKNEYGENYSIVYPLSLVGAAQAERHRTTDLRIAFTEPVYYYTPAILDDSGYEVEWLRDLATVKYPQAQIVTCHERGTIEAFTQKCVERLCGCAQEEIRNATLRNTAKYYKAVQGTYLEDMFERVVSNGKVRLKCDVCGRCSKPCGEKSKMYDTFNNLISMEEDV